MSDKTLGKARGLNSIADPRSFKGSQAGRSRLTRREAAELAAESAPSPSPMTSLPSMPMEAEPARPVSLAPPAAAAEPRPAAAPHRAVTPGIQRKRRELSVPYQIADAVERTGINAADIVMAGYRRHADAIYAGLGGRMAARGRRRLRLSISDNEFDQLTRLGEARGWNRSETVSVILAMELMPEAADFSTTGDDPRHT